MSVEVWRQPELSAGPRDVVDGWAHQVAAVAKLAAVIAATEFVPKAYRGSDTAVTAAILMGREIGIGPLTALQGLYVVDGRPAMAAQLMRALVFAHGHRIRVVSASSVECTLAGQRRGDPAESAITWTTEDARRAGLLGRTNWQHYPRQMLLARCTGELCRVLFPDVIGGMAYTVEEVEDGTSIEGAETPAPTRKIRRGRTPAALPSSPTAGESPPEPEAAPPHTSGPVGTPPPLPGDIVDEPEPEAAPAERSEPAAMLTPGQRSRLFAMLGAHGFMEPRADRLRAVGGLAGRRVKSLNDLTEAEASKVMDAITLAESLTEPGALDALIQAGWDRIADQEQPALWEDPEEGPGDAD